MDWSLGLDRFGCGCVSGSYCFWGLALWGRLGLVVRGGAIFVFVLFFLWFVLLCFLFLNRLSMCLFRILIVIWLMSLGFRVLKLFLHRNRLLFGILVA